MSSIVSRRGGVVTPSPSSSSTTTNNHQHQDEVKWIAHEGIREELGLLLCNQRRPLRETISEFPHVDFSLLQQHQEEHDGYDEDEDIFWKQYCEGRMLDTNNGGVTTPPRRETMEDMSHRAYDFLVDYLLKRPEMEIAVVGHSAWLLAMTSAVLEFDHQDQYDNERGGGVKEFGTMFGQAELRSATLTYSQHDNR